MLRTITTPSTPAAAAFPGFITTPDDAALFYRDWGRGKPLVFLAAWTLNSEAWAYQMEPLSRQGFRCIAYDRRAHGRSSDPGRGHDYDTLAGDLAAVLDTLDLQDVTLVAHSFAGGEAVRYLTRYGTERVSRVLFLAPAGIPFMLRTADNPDGIDGEVFEEIQQAYLDDLLGWAEGAVDPYFVPGTSRAAADWTLRMMSQTSLQAALELSRIQSTTDFRIELPGIDVPTLFIHGDADASVPLELTSRPAAALIPNARLVVYEGAPHGLYFTHKQRLNRDIAAFARGENEGAR